MSYPSSSTAVLSGSTAEARQAVVPLPEYRSGSGLLPPRLETAVFCVGFYGTSSGSSGGSTAPSGSTANTSAVVPLWGQDPASLVSAAIPLGGSGSTAYQR